MPRGAWKGEKESVLPFQLSEAGVRGRAVRLGMLLDELLGRWSYPPAVEMAVTETVVLAALIGQIVNVKWKLSLQVRGDGPLRVIAADYIAPERAGEHARLRAFASFDAGRVKHAALPSELYGKGYFAVLVDRDDGNQPYQGLVPLEGRDLAECAAAYFQLSEQLPTHFALATTRLDPSSGAGHWRAGGVMIQYMPSPSPLHRGDKVTETTRSSRLGAVPREPDDENWRRARALLDTTEDHELTDDQVPLARLIYRLFHEEDPLVYDQQLLRFGCTCSEAKVKQGMSIYSSRDIATMTTAEGVVTADCQFCGAHYEFNPAHLGFEATGEAGGGDC